MKPNVLQNRRKAFCVRHTLRVTLAQCARSAAKTTSLLLTREMYVHNNYQLRCEISARVISRAAPIKANCGTLSPACAANSQPPRRLNLRNARHRHTSGRVMHCVLCVCVLDSLSQRAVTRRINKINTRSADSPTPRMNGCTNKPYTHVKCIIFPSEWRTL
jgi:hypothetical protein